MSSNRRWKNAGIIRNGVKKSGSITSSRKPFSTIHSISESNGERTVKKLRLSKALTIPEGTTILDACKRMMTLRADAALLTDANGLLCGIITDKDVTIRVVAEGVKPDETPVSKVMTKNPVFVLNDTLAVEALQKMVQGKFRHLPVVQDGEVTALLDITKCLYDAIARMEREAEKGNAIAAAVEDVGRQWGNADFGPVNMVDALRRKMFRPSLESIIQENANVAIVSPLDTVYMAAKKMKDLQVNSVIVSKNNKPQGILTSKDIVMRVVSKNLQPNLTAVGEVMTPNPECVTITMSIADALHTMHDGKFLHLPVLDQDGCIIACLDVLHLTHAALAIVGTDGVRSTDMTSIMLHKFLDSALLWEPPGGDDDQSDASMPKSYADDLSMDEVKYASESTFSFKLEDSNGKVHRFQSGTKSLAELTSTIVQRMEVDKNRPPHIMYVDEEGDHVLLLTDSDLATAVSCARLLGWKTLKLHLESFCSSIHQSSPCHEPMAVRAEKTSGRVGNDNEWTLYTTSALMGVVMIAGVSMLIYLRRH